MPQKIEVAKGRQGRHTFFVGTMTWGELDQMLVFPDDPALTRIDDDDKRMQRDLQKDRIETLVEYLVEAEDHFFSALCLVILPRDLNRPARLATEESDEWDYLFTAAKKELPGPARRGFLDISGEAKLFTADGQHRGRSGKEALVKKPELAREDVPVVIVPYENPDQVRQLFADLNLNATKPDKTLALEFDSRDPIVRLAKQATADIDLFRGRVNRISRSLAPASAHVITLKSLVDGTREMASALAGPSEGGSAKKKKDSRAAQLKAFLKRDEAVAELRGAWETIVHAFEEKWDTVMEGKAPGDLREAYVFPHGLGWEALTHAASQLITQRRADWAEAFQRACRSIDWRRTNRTVWQNVAVIYDDAKETNRVNNTVSGVRATAAVVLRAAGLEDVSVVEEPSAVAASENKQDASVEPAT